MSFYMIHIVVAEYVSLLVGLEWHFANANLHPLQSAFFLICAILVGYAITEAFEKPANTALRSAATTTAKPLDSESAGESRGASVSNFGP